VSTASDISFSGPAGTFNLRVAAVIFRGDPVLLCTVDGLDYWFLPELTGTLRHVVLTTP
jgi:hypothetical protein